MRIYIGSDHAGYELKNHLAQYLSQNGYDVTDVGPHDFDPEDDYPAFCFHTADAVVNDVEALGIVIGGSGNGEQIAANKVAGCRAALAWSEETARLSRQHNDANVVSLGARMHTLEEAERIVEVFLTEPFSAADRHQRRIDQVTDYEKARQLPPLPH
ncbi:ribose-5-phosphate isomerase [Haloglycomyces albus]|uniref:ribose-5-phosphate isomerase n=1 Tax=Haloglycomyces albus TaxID=526067 RepID=UPI00046D7A36|nr:ribose-5-phosphate isomerase [Haloglycomyces albus]